MAGNRKRGIAQTTSKESTARKVKRAQVSEPNSSPHPHGDFDSQQEYQVRNILDERGGKYLIDWEDDPITGQKYKATWEPKENANEKAVSDWERQKASKARKSRVIRSSGEVDRPHSTAEEQPQDAPRKRGRPRKTLPPSSPEVGPAPSPPADNDELSEDPLEIGESQDVTEAPQPFEDDPEESLFLPELDSFDIPKDNLFSVRPSDPPSSYQEYEAFSSSQIVTGTAPEQQSFPQSNSYQPDSVEISKTTTEPTTEISVVPTASSQKLSSVSVDPGTRTVIVIPDSQSQQASLSFLLSQTQHDTTDNSEEQLASQAADLDQTSEVREAPSNLARDRVPRDQDQTALDKRSVAPDIEDLPAPSVSSHSPGHLHQFSQAVPAAGKESEPTPGHTQSGEFVVQPVHDILDGQGLQSRVPGPSKQPHLTQSQTSTHNSGLRNNVSSTSQIVRSIDPKGRADLLEPSEPPSDAVDSFERSSNFPDRAFGAEPDFEQADVPASGSSQPFLTQVASSLAYPPQETQAQRAPLPHSQPLFSGQSPRSTTEAPHKAASVPLLQTSLGQVSSPFPSVPSHSVQEIGASAPARLSTPSSPVTGSSSRPPTPGPATMSTPGGSKLGFAEQMKAFREQKRAERRARMSSATAADSSPAKPTAVPARINEELAAETPTRARTGDAASDRGRSPSAVPAVRPVEAATQDEMNTSERYPTLVPTGQDRATLRRQSTITKSDHAKQSGNSLHAVPIALMGHQRDAYPTMINKHKDLIAEFLSTSQPSEALVSSVEELLERLRRITVHPDLDNAETFTQYSVEASISATWDVDCSVKFRFLKQLCEHLRHKELTIAVVAQAGHLLEILETFFAGIKITCNKVDKGYSQEQAECALTVNILSSTKDASADSVTADIVVALDGTASAGCRALRLLQEDVGGAKPLLLALVVPNTVEHIERCLSRTLSSRQKLRALINGVCDLRLEAGRLEEGQTSLNDSVIAVIDYLANSDVDKEWPLATLSMLEILDSQTESEIEPPSTEDGVRPGGKRALDEDEMEVAATGSSKRPRIEQPNGNEHSELLTTINPLDIEVTHISDSVSKPSLSLLNTSDLAPAPGMSETEKRLQSLLLAAQARVEDHAQALADLQYRHEDQRTQLIETINERDSAITTAQKAVERLTDLNKTASALRVERDELKTNLITAQAALLNHNVPERAEIEQLRQTSEQAVKSRVDLERRLKTVQDDLDYARDMYQTSSSQAQAMASQTQDLENRLSHAQNRATGEQARARQMTLDAQTKNIERENKQLKLRLQERETSLRLKDEELAKLREASRGRMGTRGTSVPRSPRMASPKKLAGGGPGSRQGSPAAGDLRSRGHQMLHPLRQG